jgi:hypothetical protein
MKLAGVTQMALLKSKAAKAAAATDAARILSSAPAAEALEISTTGSAADWSYRTTISNLHRAPHTVGISGSSHHKERG